MNLLKFKNKFVVNFKNELLFLELHIYSKLVRI